VRELVGIYGVHTYTQWSDRLESEDQQALRHLSDTEERLLQLATHPAHEVCSYEQQVELMSCTTWTTPGWSRSGEPRGDVVRRR
jgi:hypothetical protein